MLKSLLFKDFITLQRGFDLPRKNMIMGQYPVVGSTSIVGWHNEYKIEPPGVVTGRSGSLGTVQFIKDKYWPHNTSLWVRDFKNNLPKYVFYYLINFPLENFNSGAGVPTLNRNHLDNYKINIHNWPNQKKIASILSAYDDLIENNTKRIAILEEMAQRIYKEWFVDFKYPGYENDQMVYSELGMIPEGWEIMTLGDVLKTLESGSRPKGGIDPAETEVVSIGAENILGLGKYNFSKEKYINREFFDNMTKGHVRSNDVLLYKDGAKIGRKSMFKDNFPHNDCCINEHVFILRTNDNCSQSYLYFWLDLQKTTTEIINLNSNAAQPGVNQKGVKSLVILLAEKTIMKKFEDIVSPILSELFNLAKKNRLLQLTRDLLLPKLISGKIDVSETDIDISELE